MAKQQFLSNYVPIICVIISILFFATPSPWGVMKYLFPLSNLLVLSCWLFFQPKLIPLFTVFVLGLLANLYSPYSLGTEAFIWLLVYLSIELLRSIMPEPGFIIIWVWWVMVVICRTGLMILMAYIHFGVWTIDVRILYDILFAVLDFPLYFIIFLFLDLQLFTNTYRHKN